MDPRHEAEDDIHSAAGAVSANTMLMLGWIPACAGMTDGWECAKPAKNIKAPPGDYFRWQGFEHKRIFWLC
jgi:hypothetical protein